MSVLEAKKSERFDSIEYLDFAPGSDTLLCDPNSIDHLDFTVSTEVGALAVSEQYTDLEARQAAAQFIGAVTVRSSVETSGEESRFRSLFDAVRAAYHGDVEAKAMVRANSKTDVIERTIKAGHVIEAVVDISSTGTQQNGQTLRSVHANALRFAARSPEMTARTHAEVRNYFRLEQYIKSGALEGCSFVVFSCAPDDMSTEEAQKVGFFTDTMSCSIQLSTISDGKLVTESAFVAGVKEPGVMRHDIEAVKKVALSFGVDLSGKSATEILDSPLLIPHVHTSNGVVDIVERFDDAVAYVSDSPGSMVFFGQAQARKDYAQYLMDCKERELLFDPKVEAIANDLVRMFPRMHDEAHACQMLNEISGKHMIEQAVFDYSIDPRVFGLASKDIYKARRAMELGDVEQGLSHIEHAKENDQSSSCAGGVEGRTSELESNKSCSFISQKCPKCRAKKVMTTVRPSADGKKKLVSGSCGCSQVYDNKDV